MATYQYTIEQFPNQLCDPERLSKEIQESSIVIALDSITDTEDIINIVFKDILSDTDKQTLDNIVSNHSGEPLPIQFNSTLLDMNGNPISNDNPLRIAEIENPRDIWNKLMQHDTPRPPDCDTYFTGAGDDPNNTLTYGSGDILFFRHTVGDGTDSHIKYLDLNIAHNKSYLFSAWITGQNAMGDTLTAEIVPRVTNIVTGQTGTQFSLYNGYLIVPSASILGEGENAGTIDIEKDNDGNYILEPFQCLISQKTGKKTPGWWNMTYDHDTHRWTNLTPVLDGTGDYNLFAIEIPLDRFVNKFILLGNTTIYLYSYDTAQLPLGTRIRINVERNLEVDDHDFMVAINLYMHRERTT